MLKVNSGATAVEWANESGGSSSEQFKTISVSGQSDVAADNSTDTLTLVAGTNITITTDTFTDTITITSSGGSSSTEVSFFAHRDGSAQSISASTDTVVEFDNTDINESDDFYTAYNYFKADIAGRYWLTAAVSFDDLSTGNVQCFIRIRKNGTNIISEGRITQSGESDPYLDTACLVDAAVDDYFDVVVYHDDLSDINIHGDKTVTNFQGFKI